eukprot:2588161-Prymnesium_polylepis.1
MPRATPRSTPHVANYTPVANRATLRHMARAWPLLPSASCVSCIVVSATRPPACEAGPDRATPSGVSERR